MWPADLVTFTEKNLDEKLHFLCSGLSIASWYRKYLQYIKQIQEIYGKGKNMGKTMIKYVFIIKTELEKILDETVKIRNKYCW